MQSSIPSQTPSARGPKGGANRGLHVGFLLVLAVFAGSACLSLLNGQAVLRDNEAVDHSEQVLQAQTQVRADLAGVESAARGFIASGRPEYIVEYAGSKRNLLGSIQSLRSLTLPGHAGERAFQELGTLIQQRFAQMDAGIARARRGERTRRPTDSEALASQATRQRVRQILDSLQESEGLIMKDRREQSQQGVEWARIGLLSSGIIGVLALTGFFFAVQRSFDAARRLRLIEQERAEELEERVRERTRELSQANRDLEAFSYSVSHDLRAPLRAMNGFASILKKDLDGRMEPAETHMLERIQRNCVKMSELTESLLALFRVGKAELTVEEVNLSTLAADVVADLRADYPGVDHKVRIQPGLTVMGDRQMMNALLVNLLGNAMKFSSKVPNPSVEFWGERTEEGDVFAIRDNGAGFDPAQSGLLFEPFHRLHAESEFAGNGVGLAMCRKIVARHRGSIWLDSEIDHGATVRFRLGLSPVAARAGEFSAESSRESAVVREPVQG